MDINIEQEIWKDIDGFPGYQISNLGRVRSFRDYHGNISDVYKILKLELNKDNYYQILLYTTDHKKVHKRVHRLVCDAFYGPEPNLVVNHINGDKHDNRLSNLEWVTAEENSRLASESGLYMTKPVRIVETGEIFNSIKDCADTLKVHSSSVSHVLSGRDKNKSVAGVHVEFAEKVRKPFLFDYQQKAVKNMKNGCILNGGVGSGKSRTGLYYWFEKNGGRIDEYGYVPMKTRQDLYIITTARKRDTYEWVGELAYYLLGLNSKENALNMGVNITIDSWNNIGKYSDVSGAFFIFDEQRVVGSGAWVKAFLKIARINEWILLSATAGDTWQDYIPVFLANGFYRNKTEFTREHIIYSRFTKFPKVDRYVNTGRLIRLRNSILVDMDFTRQTIAHHEDVYCSYDLMAYRDVNRRRWDPFNDMPIQNIAGLCYILRKITNSDQSRQVALMELLEKHPKAIIFYNFDYELDILKNLYYGEGIEIAEWNGHAHQPVPKGDRWIYLVQYTAGCEGWNCVTTNTIIFYSQNYSYKVMAQASGRIDRLNTPYKELYYYHLKSRSGIDLAISKALNQKKKFNEGKFVKW